jgi:hypothetical protein
VEHCGLTMKGDCVSDLVDRMQQEIGERLNELRPLVEESERLKVAAKALDGMAGSTLTVRTPAASTPAAAETSPVRAPQRVKGRRKASGRKRKGALLSGNQRAIIAALEHGAHTVRELVTVTGMGDQTARNNVKSLLGLEKVVKTERGGKAAYALPSSN